jgi:2-succinyl-5-enolpyruvyl-6-hydroxy-3-cyclohexene-1-carboxylate synthase
VTQSRWAQRFVDALAHSGLGNIVISPGSRSTPFVLAAVDHCKLRVHVVIDERSAGFFALGQAKVTGRPTALLCTSGTAGAHYYPAVIEAAYARVPLIVITADRPAELAECGAPQTIDQTGLFGRHVRRTFDLGVADDRDAALRAVARKAVHAVAAATGPEPGPVHINAPARKPLEPRAPAPADADRTTAYYPAERRASDRAIAALARRCRGIERGLIVCGPAPVSQHRARSAVAALSAATGFPLLAEAASQVRFGLAGCPSFDAVVRAVGAREPFRPELIIQVGAAPTSGAWPQYLAAHPTCARWILAEHPWPDPDSSADGLIVGDIADAVVRLGDAIGPGAAPGQWSLRWARADEQAWLAVGAELAGQSQQLGEGAVARATVDALPPGSLLAVGNGMPIRAVDTFCRSAADDITVLSQRGANGIDGLISGAAGAASVRELPTALLLGDVSAAHDIGGLAAAAAATTPLAIVVVDNQGGRIFEHLPIATATDPHTLERLWLTPPAFDLARVVSGYREVGYQRVDHPNAVRGAVAAALDRRGTSVVHAVVDGAQTTAGYQRLWRAVEARLS